MRLEAGQTARCTTCHATNNIGNHPKGNFFVRIGSDSVRILQKLADAHPDVPSLQDFVTRTKMLPQYCLRSNGSRCTVADRDALRHLQRQRDPRYPCRRSDQRSWTRNDHLESGLTSGSSSHLSCARGLAPRFPYFHGSAADSTVSIVDFYDARFKIGLAQDEKNDLVPLPGSALTYKPGCLFDERAAVARRILGWAPAAEIGIRYIGAQDEAS